MITRNFTIIAQDPSIKNADGSILKTQIQIPMEELAPGPRGHRIHVVDYDSSEKVFYKPYNPGKKEDPFATAGDDELLDNPEFHAQNVYAIIMRLLGRFEASVGRRISWGFGGHQIHVAPHAFSNANAFYSSDARGIFFGYFQGRNQKPVFTCLSHDIVTHEATHALLDGLRESFTFPSHPDQAGFHEGFSDIVALLSVFGLKDVVKALLLSRTGSDGNFIDKKELSVDNLKKNVLLGLAEQFGKEVSNHRADCLRRAVARPPEKDAIDAIDFEQAHLRGEILSAAVLNSFIDVWTARLKTWLPRLDKSVPVARVIEDAGDAANHLLNICIRALDYCPVVDITFGDFLSALLTADYELVPDDNKYKYREILIKQFKVWNIEPAAESHHLAKAKGAHEPGTWQKPPGMHKLNYSRLHRESLERDKNEVFHFLWDNRKRLNIFENAYTWIISLRPSVRIAPDGFVLKETVSEYRQVLEIEAGKLGDFCPGMEKPEGMPDDLPVKLNGGGVFIFDEFAHLKYHIHSRINNPESQLKRLEYLWRNGIHDRDGRYGFSSGTPKGQQFALMHMRRDGVQDKTEEWDDEQ
ncbi:MAG: hypothetical protein GY757_25255 [bacterium]|nr:hypothetical protein [bacterium]